MDAKKTRRVLPKKKLEEVVQNLDNLSDLSGSDSEDDSCYVNSINSPSNSYLNQLDDHLIEQRLEYIFGFELNEDKQETPTIQAQQISTDRLLTDLGETSRITNPPKPDSPLLTHLDTENDECNEQPQDIHAFNEVQQDLDVIDVPMEEFLGYDEQSETNNEIRRDRSESMGDKIRNP